MGKDYYLVTSYDLGDWWDNRIDAVIVENKRKNEKRKSK